MPTDVKTAALKERRDVSADASKTQQITDYLLDKVQRSAFSVGDRLPSRSALAQQFGVSNSTASIALNNLRKHVPMEWVPGKGFFLTNPQVSLFKVGVIGRFASRLHSATTQHDVYWHPLFLSLQSEALRQRTTITWIPETEREPVNLDHVLDIRPDCVISFAIGLKPETCFALRERNVAYVSGNYQLERLGISYVDYDWRGTFAEMVRIFHENGHRRIAVLAITVAIPENLNIAQGVFINALACRNCFYSYKDYWRVLNVRYEEPGDAFVELEKSAYAETLSLLDLPEPPTAIYCWNAVVAQGAARAIEERGLRVGQDISILISGCPEDARPYSMFAEPHNELAARILETAKQAAMNPQRVYQIAIPQPYIDRGTVGGRPESARQFSGGVA